MDFDQERDPAPQPWLIKQIQSAVKAISARDSAGELCIYTEMMKNELLDFVELEYFQNALKRQLAHTLRATLPLILSVFND